MTDRSLTRSSSSVAWPALRLVEWEDTLATLRLWTQIVGKIRMASEPMINHWWQVPLYVSARGLTTSLFHPQRRGLEMEFDFIDQLLHVRSSDGDVREVVLEPRSVATFYRSVMTALDELDIRVTILGRPVELEEAMPFAEDERHFAYDASAVHRFWLALVQAHRVMTEFRGRFVGKASPVHFFWGAADLATSRFSGRVAPKHPGGVPNCADWVQELAYSHEVSSCGYWPGGEGEGFFYSYVYPQPDGFDEWPVRPDSAYYAPSFGEYVLPYTAVRTADDPDGALLEFFQNTYEAAAELGKWDRSSLEASW